MKKLYTPAGTGTKKVLFNPFACFLLMLVSAGVFFAACQKNGLLPPGNDALLKDNAALNNASKLICGPNGDPIRWYAGLDPITVGELQQARAATSRYQNINNAIADGYADIGVNVQNMGHHYMKTALVDAIFDIEHPEILVYNRNDKGVQDLVAVEYAVPKSYPMPEGFTGSADVWNGTSGFPLWLLHAWVWKYNPDGVFNWTNPAVHLH